MSKKYTKGGRLIFDGSDETKIHGSYNPKIKCYYNSSTDKWVSYPIQTIKSKHYRYEFDYFKEDDCKILFSDYNVNTQRVLKFLDIVYRRFIYTLSNDRFSDNLEGNFIRVYYKEFETILGNNRIKYNNEDYLQWEVILNILGDNDIITWNNTKHSKYNYNKPLWYIKLNDEFFNCKKRNVKITDSRLVLHLNKKSNKIYKTFEKFNKLESNFVKKLDLSLSKGKIEEMALIRYNFKKEQAIEQLNWNILSHKSSNSIKEQLKSRFIYNKPTKNNRNRFKTYKDEYINMFKEEYNDFTSSLRDLKNGVYLDNRFSREKYGYRITNLLTNLNRDLRYKLKCDNEDLITIDLRNSYISLFYSLIQIIYDYKLSDKKGKKPFGDIYDKVDISDCIEFYNIHTNLTFKYDYNPLVKDYDFYKYVGDKLSFNNVKVSRYFVKELVNRIINSNNVFMKHWKVGKYDINDIKEIIFTKGGVKFIDEFKQKEMSKIWNLDYTKDNYNQYKNLNILLVRLESLVMKKMMEMLYSNNIEFVSVYDSVMVRKVDTEKTIHILNTSVKEYGKGLIFKI